jgi:hypothetical protein
MQEYESRIIWPTGRIVLVSRGSHPNDFSAVEAVQKLRRNDELVEVWRGDVCIYSECPSRIGGLV